MSKSQRVRVEDVSELIRLTHELHEIEGDRRDRVTHFLNRACRLLSAQVLFINDVAEFGIGRAPRLLWWLFGGSLDEAALRVAGELPPALEGQGPFVMEAAKLSDRQGAYRRCQLVEDDEWYRSDFFDAFHKRVGLDDVIGAIHPIGPNCRSLVLGAHRPLCSQHFGERERTLMEIINREFEWFFREVIPAIEAQHLPCRASRRAREAGCLSATDAEFLTHRLPRRLSQVLKRLAEGEGEKQIALNLRLSCHTVHDHVKRLYRLFGVSTRVDLVRLYWGGGRDCAGGDLDAPICG